MRKSLFSRALMLGLLCFSLTMAGCSAKSSSSNVDQTPEETEVETTEPETTEPESESEPEDEKSWFDLGAVEDGVYTNEQSGITVTPTEEWSIFTIEQLNQVAMQGYEYLSDAQKKQYEKAMETTKYLFGASSQDGSSVMYIVENISANPITANLNEEGYIKALKQQLEMAEMSYEFGEVMEVEAAGRIWTALPCYSMGMAQRYLVCKVDGKIESFIITVPGEDENKIDEIIDYIGGL
ncbi:MAG: hypothetical protein ACRDBO_08975 [Lachnospiraceae bacterium]